MKSSPLALLTLLVGLVAGTGVGMALGGGSGPPAEAANRMVDRQTTVRRDAPRSSDRGGASSNDLAAVSPTVLPASMTTGSSGVVEAAARSASKQALGRGEASVQSAGFDESWTGTISGTVLDGNGIALEGATVVASNGDSRYSGQARGTDTTKVGRAYAGPTDVEEALQERAESLLEARQRRRVATTDAAGRFELTGLRIGKQSLRAYAEGLVFEYAEVHTDQKRVVYGKKIDIEGKSKI